MLAKPMLVLAIGFTDTRTVSITKIGTFSQLITTTNYLLSKHYRANLFHSYLRVFVVNESVYESRFSNF